MIKASTFPDQIEEIMMESSTTRNNTEIKKCDSSFSVAFMEGGVCHLWLRTNESGLSETL